MRRDRNSAAIAKVVSRQDAARLRLLMGSVLLASSALLLLLISP